MRKGKFLRRLLGLNRLEKLYRETSRYYGAGVYFNSYKNRLMRYSCNSRSLRTLCNRKLRRRMNSDLGYVVANGCQYRKHVDYWWMLI